MRPVVVGITLVYLLVGTWCAVARGDGGAPRFWERAGDFEIAAFTSPTPFRAGPVDISVLVLDAATGEPVPGLGVTVGLTPRGRPGGTVRHPATAEAATNKLFHAAVIELPEPGEWEVEFAIEGARGHARVRFELEAAEASRPWGSLWPWFGWATLAIILDGFHQRLVWRKTGGPLARKNGSPSG